MKKFINKITGTVMWVDDSREDEYKKLGHKMGEETTKKQSEVGEEVAPVQQKKRSTRKK